jgi:4-hydroxy-2-oxoheptanedioate aldolase
MLALAGFDFVVCDMEHAQITEVEARAVVYACRAAGIAALVRLPDPEQGVVNRLLEAGAVGIQVPRHRTGEETRRLRAMLLYPPDGVRSVGNAYPLAGYGTVPPAVYMPAANSGIVLVGQFETRDVQEPIDRAMDGLDVAFIGLMDLSVDYGAPGKFDHPEVVAHVRKIEDAARRNGVAMGGVASSTEQAKALVDAGYHFVTISSDTTIFLTAARSLLAEVRDSD